MRKYVYSIGAIAAVVAPTIAVVACSDDDSYSTPDVSSSTKLFIDSFKSGSKTGVGEALSNFYVKGAALVNEYVAEPSNFSEIEIDKVKNEAVPNSVSLGDQHNHWIKEEWFNFVKVNKIAKLIFDVFGSEDVANISIDLKFQSREDVTRISNIFGLLADRIGDQAKDPKNLEFGTGFSDLGLSSIDDAKKTKEILNKIKTIIASDANIDKTNGITLKLT